jgi:hypothetical protein
MAIAQAHGDQFRLARAVEQLRLAAYPFLANHRAFREVDGMLKSPSWL